MKRIRKVIDGKYLSFKEDETVFTTETALKLGQRRRGETVAHYKVSTRLNTEENVKVIADAKSRGMSKAEHSRDLLMRYKHE